MSRALEDDGADEQGDAPEYSPLVFEAEAEIAAEAEVADVFAEQPSNEPQDFSAFDAFLDAEAAKEQAALDEVGIDDGLFASDEVADLSALDDLLDAPLHNRLKEEPQDVLGDREIGTQPQAGTDAVTSGDSDALEDEFSDIPFGGSVRKEGLTTREALEVARATMTEAQEPETRNAFGLKRRGGKSKLQEKLDKKASGEGSGFRKIFGASALAALVVGGGYGFLELSNTGQGSGAKTSLGAAPRDAAPEALAAVALSATPTEAVPSTDIASTEGASLFERATELLDRGDDRGVEALKRAAELGHPGAQLRLAGLYEDGGSGIDADPSESRSWARRAAEGGDPRAMHYYAMQLYQGVGGSQNQAAALGWLKRAAEAGRVDSQFNVARLYETGDTGVAKNPVEAFKWYMIAARRGDQQALAAVQRLTPVTDADTRRKAREAADAFTVDPVA